MRIPNFAEKLEGALKERGLTQAAFADLAGFTPRYMSRVKTGGDEIPEVTVKKICAALGMSPAEFLQDTEQQGWDYIPVPFREAAGGMGGGSHVGSKRIISYISLKRDFLRTKTNSPESLSYISAEGESMFPTIPHGAMVLIDESQTEPINNKVFYILLNNEYLIKRLETDKGRAIAIISDNGKVRQELGPDDNLQILGMAIMQQTML